MKTTDFKIEGLKVIEPKVFGDDRGYFYESYNENTFKEAGIACHFVQDNQSYSKRGTLRGLHFQLGAFAQSKLVRVIFGEVLDVAVDLRKGSKTYGEHEAVLLTGENQKQFFIPKGFAHGFVVLSKDALFQYKCDNFYNKESEGSIRFDDKQLNINWQMAASDILVSEKDNISNTFQQAEEKYDFSHWS